MSIELKSDNLPEVSHKDKKRLLKIHIPTDADTATSLELDAVITVTIKGKVKEIEARKGCDWCATPGSIDVEVDSIMVDGKNAFEDLID